MDHEKAEATAEELIKRWLEDCDFDGVCKALVGQPRKVIGYFAAHMTAAGQTGQDDFDTLATSLDYAESEAADKLEDGIRDKTVKGMVRSAADRQGLARVAKEIRPEDLYSAVSTAARVALIVLVKHGAKAAFDFVADLERYERR